MVDAAGYTLAAATRLFRRPRVAAEIKKILVVEPWQIGDVVLVIPLLAELRKRFPEARVTLLAKPHAAEILAGSGLVDEFIEADLPWTRSEGKYRVTARQRRQLRQLVRSLRSGEFDLVLDARGDPRSHLLTAFTGAPERVGYDLGGGWLLTRALKGEPDKRHKVDDWLNLLSTFGFDLPRTRQPKLEPDSTRVESARQTLRAHGVEGRPLIAVHPGASHAGKTWPLERFAHAAQELREEFGGSTFVFVDPTGYGEKGDWPRGTIFVKSGLRDLMAYTSLADVFLCDDSGPMHIADALGVPVVAIFERGNPQWFGPSGARARVILGENAGKGISAAPTDEAPANPVAVERVVAAAGSVLEESDFARKAEK